MAITIYEGFPSRETIRGDKPSIETNWVILGTRDDQLAYQFLSACDAHGLHEPAAGIAALEGSRPGSLGMLGQV